MKKYLITGGVGLAIVLGLAWYLFVYSDFNDFTANPTTYFKSASNNSLISKLPNDFDQLLYLRMDDDLREVAGESNTVTDKETFNTIINTMDEIIVYQYLTQDASHNLLFITGGDGFSIEKIEELGLLAGDENYQYESLGGKYWVYGSENSIKFFKDSKKGGIVSNDGFKTFERAFRAGGHNVGFYSVPADIDGMEGASPLVGQFAKALKNTYLVSTLRMENPTGRIVLQFADGTLQGSEADFVPSILPKLNEDPLFFTEFHDVLSLAGVDATQLNILLPVLVGQLGAGITLNQEDILSLTSALKGNIAMVVVPSGISPFGMGVRLVFNDENVYPALKALMPLAKNFLETGLEQPGGVNQEETDNSLTLTFGGPSVDEAVVESGSVASGAAMPEQIQLPVAELVKINGTTSLSLFTQLPLQIDENVVNKIPLQEVPKNTAMIFGWNATLLLEQSFLQAQINEQDAFGASALFQSGVVIGSVQIDPDIQQVHIEFESRNTAE